LRAAGLAGLACRSRCLELGGEFRLAGFELSDLLFQVSDPTAELLQAGGLGGARLGLGPALLAGLRPVRPPDDSAVGGGFNSGLVVGQARRSVLETRAARASVARDFSR